MKIIDAIKFARKSTGETLAQFGKRFGVTATAVNLWESGKREAPYEVIEFVLKDRQPLIICPRCSGKGVTTRFVPEVGPSSEA